MPVRDVSLANSITTVTNGPTIAVQPFGATEPVELDLRVSASATGGTPSCTFDVEGSTTGLGSWTAITTYTIDGFNPYKAQSFQQIVRVPYVRVNVTAISGTAATLNVHANV